MKLFVCLFFDVAWYLMPNNHLCAMCRVDFYGICRYGCLEIVIMFHIVGSFSSISLLSLYLYSFYLPFNLTFVFFFSFIFHPLWYPFSALFAVTSLYGMCLFLWYKIFWFSHFWNALTYKHTHTHTPIEIE